MQKSKRQKLDVLESTPEMFSYLADHITEGVAFVNKNTLHIVRVNQAFRNLFGFNAEFDLSNTNIASLFNAPCEEILKKAATGVSEVTLTLNHANRIGDMVSNE